MPKRKRGGKDPDLDEERHSKIRVQEVKLAETSAKKDQVIDATEPARAEEAENGNPTELSESKRKKSRKRKEKESREPETMEKVVNMGEDVATSEQVRGVEGVAQTRKSKKSKGEQKLLLERKEKINTDAEALSITTNSKKSGSNLTSISQWKTSDAVGGQMIDLDPIFSHDEQHLLVAYDTSIAIYSTATSLLIRRFQIQTSSTITGLALDPLREEILYATTLSGEISKWNWTEGQRSNERQVSSKILAAVTARQSAALGENDLIYTISENPAGPGSVSAHRFADGKKSSEVEAKVLLKFEKRLTHLIVSNGGKLIIATSGQKLIIGASNSPIADNLSHISYVWRVVDCPEWIVSIDVRCRATGRTSKKHSVDGRMLEAVDVVLGGLKGTIHVYEDLLQKLLREEKTGKESQLENVVSRALHWHRNAVSSVKWSLDGNYIISGGQETVLVLWQLETGQKQHLPHLGAAIESIVVSPTGSSYSVRLTDNSVMILSTAELRPTFSVAGVQMPATRKILNPLPFVPTVDMPREIKAKPRKTRYPACVTHHDSNRVLLAVPPSSMSSSIANMSESASYLQTCDLNSGHQLSRQALTRTKITTFNKGPESNTIADPDVTQMQTSHDGQWLATIDEWSPPKRDLELLTFDDEACEQEQIAHQEIYLKFWSWNNDDKLWELVARIDNPHASDSGDLYKSGRVLGLTSNPTNVKFATIDGEGELKIWEPTTRMRGELKVRGRDGEALTTWRCLYSVPTTNTTSSTEPPQLAYSPDGSLLAVGSLATPSSASCISLINTSTGRVERVHMGLSSGPIFGLGIISKYLILLSNSLLVWDLVDNEVHYEIDLQLRQLAPPQLPPTRLLSINHHHSIFALALPSTTENKPSDPTTTTLAIMTPTTPTPLFTTNLPATITHLLPSPTKKAFHALDTAAQIRTFTVTHSIPTGLPTPPTDPYPHPQTPSGLSELFGGAAGTDTATATTSPRRKPSKLGMLASKSKALTDRDRLIDESKQNHNDGDDDDDGSGDGDGDGGAVVVTPEKLAKIFEYTAAGGSALGMPPVTELFERVARLVVGRRGLTSYVKGE